MDLYTALQDKNFDVRLIERNINSGAVSEQDKQKKLSELPDLAPQSEPLKMDNSSNSDRYNL